MPEFIVYAAFIIFAFFAGTLATLAGFGSSTLLVPVAVMFLPLRQAIFLVACFHLFNNIFKVRAFYKDIDRRVAFLFGLPSIIFAFTGAVFLSKVSADTTQILIGAFLMAFCIYSWLRPEFKLHKKDYNAVIGGSASGFLAGLIGMGGAIRSAFLVAFDLPKTVYVGTSAIIAFVIDCTRVPTYIVTGGVRLDRSLALLPFLIASAYFGVKLGKVLLDRIDQKTFRKVVLVALFLVALKLLVS